MIKLFWHTPLNRSFSLEVGPKPTRGFCRENRHILIMAATMRSRVVRFTVRVIPSAYARRTRDFDRHYRDHCLGFAIGVKSVFGFSPRNAPTTDVRSDEITGAFSSRYSKPHVTHGPNSSLQHHPGTTSVQLGEMGAAAIPGMRRALMSKYSKPH